MYYAMLLQKDISNYRTKTKGLDFWCSINQSSIFFQIKYGGTNFTAFRMIDTNKMEIQSVIKGIVTKEMNNGRTLDTAIKVSFLGVY